MYLFSYSPDTIQISRKKRRGVSAVCALLVTCYGHTNDRKRGVKFMLCSPSSQVIEKRRRDRINNCLMELRRLVPQAFEKQVRVHLNLR